MGSRNGRRLIISRLGAKAEAAPSFERDLNLKRRPIRRPHPLQDQKM